MDYLSLSLLFFIQTLCELEAYVEIMNLYVEIMNLYVETMNLYVEIDLIGE